MSWPHRHPVTWPVASVGLGTQGNDLRAGGAVARDAPSLEVFEVGLDGAWSDPIQWKMSLLVAAGGGLGGL